RADAKVRHVPAALRIAVCRSGRAEGSGNVGIREELYATSLHDGIRAGSSAGQYATGVFALAQIGESSFSRSSLPFALRYRRAGNEAAPAAKRQNGAWACGSDPEPGSLGHERSCDQPATDCRL